MLSHNSSFYTKLWLIIVAEGVAMILTDLFSKYIFPIHHTTLSYIICGAVLAYIVIRLYDQVHLYKKSQVEKELRDITSVMLKKHIH